MAACAAEAAALHAHPTAETLSRCGALRAAVLETLRLCAHAIGAVRKVVALTLTLTLSLTLTLTLSLTRTRTRTRFEGMSGASSFHGYNGVANPPGARMHHKDFVARPLRQVRSGAKG